MCGIAGIHLKPRAALDRSALERFADALLLGIDNRGGDATGYVARAISGEVRLQRASCGARLFVDDRRPFPKGTRTVLLHTRFATQGDPAFPENNHPVYAGSVYCVHNGHVSNDAELFREAGADRLGRVDSESIPAIVRHYGWHDAGNALAQVEGAAAVALLEAETGALVLARAYSSPLVVVDSASFVVWASTAWAIEQAWRQTLGTPPAKDRFETLAEGDLLRFEPDGSKRTERFAPYAPAYRYVSSWNTSNWTVGKGTAGASCPAPETASKPSLRTQVLRLLGADEPEPDTSQQCDGCGDWFGSGELWEIAAGWTVCAGCENYYNWQDEADDAAADDERRARADARREIAEAEADAALDRANARLRRATQAADADAIAEGGPVYLSGF